MGIRKNLDINAPHLTRDYEEARIHVLTTDPQQAKYFPIISAKKKNIDNEVKSSSCNRIRVRRRIVSVSENQETRTRT